MIEIVENDFSKMKLDIHTLPLDESCQNTYPEIANIFLEWSKYRTESLTNDILIRFIIFCYDRRSPFVEKIENPIERKIAVLNHLKVPAINGVFPDDIQKIVKSLDGKTAKVIYHFCKFQDSLTYFALVTTTETYISLNEKLGEEIGSSKESKDTVDVMIKLQKIEERIDYLSDKLFKRDTDLKDFIGSVLVMEGRKHRLFAEDYSE